MLSSMHNVRGRLSRSLSAVVAVFASVALAPSAYAQQPAAKDTLIFNNGDQLQGVFEKADGDSVTFKSDMAGELIIKLANIKELRSGSEFAVIRKGANLKAPAVLGRVEINSGKVTVARSEQQIETLSSDQLGYVVAAPDYQRALGNLNAPFANWNGSITGGASLVRATQNGTTLTAAASLVRLAPGVPYLPLHSRATINVVESYGKLTSPVLPRTTPPTPPSTVKTNIFHADAEYDRYFSPRLYALADTAFDHNFSQGLQLQQLYGGGLGYTVISEPVQTLDVKGEIHYERQEFIQTPGTARVPENDLIGASLGESYLRNLPHKIVFTETGVYIPAFNNVDAYSANLAVGLAFPTYKRLSFSVTGSDDYLNNPPPGFKKNSFQFVTGVTYTLK